MARGRIKPCSPGNYNELPRSGLSIVKKHDPVKHIPRSGSSSIGFGFSTIVNHPAKVRTGSTAKRKLHPEVNLTFYRPQAVGFFR